MMWLRKQTAPAGASVQLREAGHHPFGLLGQYVPMRSGEIRLYRAVREAVPVVDAAIYKLIRMVGGVPVVVEASEAEHFKITPEKLAAAITPKTKALMLNSPSNPTGMIYSREHLEDIAKVCLDNALYVIADEMYSKLVFDNKEFVSFPTLSKEITARTI